MEFEILLVNNNTAKCCVVLIPSIWARQVSHNHRHKRADVFCMVKEMFNSVGY